MTEAEFLKAVISAEGKKSSVKIGDMRETWRLMKKQFRAMDEAGTFLAFMSAALKPPKKGK